MKSRDGFWTKVDEKLRSKIDSWIRSHHHVIHSPIAKDTLLVRDPSNAGQFVRKSKLILQTSVRELLIDLYKPGIGMLEDVMDKEGKRLVSGTVFRAILPPELRMITNYYKTMCMCEICQSSNYMQSALNTFRRNLLKQLENEFLNYSADSPHEEAARSILLAQLTRYKIEGFSSNLLPNGNLLPLNPTPSSTSAASQAWSRSR